MKKELINYLLEIVFAILIIIISYIFWDYKDFSQEVSYAKYYNGNYSNKYETKNLTYNFNSELEYNNLIPSTYETYDKTEAKYLMIKNNNINPINYKINIKIDKNGISDIDSVVIILNGDVIKLNDKNYIERYNDYLIETNDFLIEDSSIYRIIAYIDKDLTKELKPSSLLMNIDLVEL